MNTFKVETKSGFVPYQVWYVETPKSIFLCDEDLYTVVKIEVTEKNNEH